MTSGKKFVPRGKLSSSTDVDCAARVGEERRGPPTPMKGLLLKVPCPRRRGLDNRISPDSVPSTHRHLEPCNEAPAGIRLSTERYGFVGVAAEEDPLGCNRCPRLKTVRPSFGSTPASAPHPLGMSDPTTRPICGVRS